MEILLLEQTAIKQKLPRIVIKMHSCFNFNQYFQITACAVLCLATNNKFLNSACNHDVYTPLYGSAMCFEKMFEKEKKKLLLYSYQFELR